MNWDTHELGEGAHRHPLAEGGCVWIAPNDSMMIASGFPGEEVTLSPEQGRQLLETLFKYVDL